MAQLTGMALYAALSEHIYRRNETLDQAIKLKDITGTTNPLPVALPSGFNLQSDNGYIYSNSGGASGFVAMVNFINGKYVVTFRGTDSNLTAIKSVQEAFINGNTPAPPTGSNLYQGQLDYGDAYTSRNLASGTTAVTQWDAAKALVQSVIDLAGDKTKVVVTGQSMGGGLAGLASAYFGIEGDVFAPAPYKAQLNIEAMRLGMAAFVAARQTDPSQAL
jgi:fermentation-respiration switch protein FrsA (DUF1100 family)